MTQPTALNPAEEASARALAAVYGYLESGQSFRVEAGAGAGKTYTLVKALQYLIARDGVRLPARSQQVACITFTNVAKDEIEARTDGHPLLYVDTTHGFCWSLISGYQQILRTEIAKLPAWQDRLAELGEVGSRRVEYSHGHRSVRDDHLSLHHDDVIPLTIALLGNPKFRQIITDRFPIVLIDEYQDTDAGLVAAIKEHLLGQAGIPQFGFFGDHWQKIYGGGCGSIEHAAITVIGVEANFRSVATITKALNRMRPELPQAPRDPASTGSIHIFHTDGWSGERRKGAHWNGDLPAEAARAALANAKHVLASDGWDFSPASTKILMLTHRVLAAEQGYSSLPELFRYNEAFLKKEQPHIAFFVDQLEPALAAFEGHAYGEMFKALDTKAPAFRTPADKTAWSGSLARIAELRATGTVGEIVDHLRVSRRPRLPEAVETLERKRLEPVADGEEQPRDVHEADHLRRVPYAEIIALRAYLDGHSPFETKHGVKGAQFENVLVVVGRGWSQYNFREMLELARDPAGVTQAKVAMYERNRNLFYVACSRPMRRLALVFTQELSAAARQTLGSWFGEDRIMAVSQI